MADITCTITKDGRCDKYGRPLVAGSVYTSDADEVRSLYLAGFCTVDDARVFDDDALPNGRMVPYILAQSAVPTILLSSATSISATGAISGLTALPYVPAGVVKVYCFAQAGLAAGLYYARFSSTTACQIFTDAAGTVTPTGITAGAYAGGTTEVVLSALIVPGGQMGPSGSVRTSERWTHIGNTNVKTMKLFFGGVSLSSETVSTASHIGGSPQSVLSNRAGHS